MLEEYGFSLSLHHIAGRLDAIRTWMSEFREALEA